MPRSPTTRTLANVQSDLVKATAEIQITVDPTKAINVGLTAAQVANEVRNALVAQTVTQVTLEPGQPIDLVVQVDPEAATSVEELGQLPVGTVAKVPLEHVATVEQADVQGSITRINEAPAARVTAEILSEDTGAVSASVQSTIDALEADGSIPAGVTVELAGVSQQQTEAFGGLFASMGVAILLVYLMMVLTFNSLVTPFIILFSLPLATIGAFPALFLTGRPIGVSALIGFLMLIGIVVTNAIVLLDLVERLRRRGHADPRGAHPGRPDPRAADPDDGHRHDPGPDPARGGLQPGLDHRGRAGHRRHRRPVQLDVPDPARRARRSTCWSTGSRSGSRGAVRPMRRPSRASQPGPSRCSGCAPAAYEAVTRPEAMASSSAWWSFSV